MYECILLMGKKAEKLKYTLEEILETCTRQDSGVSDQDQSESESEISDEMDFVANHMFPDVLDASLGR